MSDRLKSISIQAILFFTGFVLLAYEFFWMKFISLSFSSTTLAISSTLAIFLAGLGFGSLFSRRLFKKESSVFILIAFLLFLSGLWNILFFKFYPELISNITNLFPVISTNNQLINLCHLIVFFVSVFPVTFMLGIIYPISNQAYVNIVGSKKDTLVALYAIEVAGSITGLLSAAQYINWEIDIAKFMIILVVLQMVFSVLIFFIPRFAMTYDKKKSTLTKTAVLFFFTGFSAFILENAWIKVFNLIFGGSSQSFVTVVVCFLLGILLGTILSRKLKIKVSTIIILLSIVCAAQILIFPQLEFLFSNLYNYVSKYEYLLLMINIVGFLLLLVPTVLMGISFPLLCDLCSDKDHLGQQVANFYGANIIGGILGSFFAGFILLPTIGLNNTVLLATLVYMCVSISVAKLEGGVDKNVVLKSSFVLFFIFVMFFLAPDDDSYIGLYHRNAVSLEDYKQEKLETKLIYSKHSSYGLVSVTEHKDKRSLRINGRPESVEGIYEQKMLAHIPVMFCTRTDNALVIGHGGGFTLATLLMYPFSNIDVVEINKYVLEAEKFLNNGKPLDDPRVRTVIADGRNHLSTNSTKYDLVVTQTAHIWENPYLYTKEFFELVSNRLTDEGIYEIWIPRYTLDKQGYKILRKTIASVFKYGGEFVFSDFSIYLVSKSPIKYTNQYLTLARVDKDISSMKLSMNQQNLTNSRFIQQFYVSNTRIEQMLKSVEYKEGSYNSDYLPALEENALKNRYQKFKAE